MNQILAKAPNASAAYVSTESRLQSFSQMFQSPNKLAEMARRNQDLETGKGLVAAVVHLVGGVACKPAPGHKFSHPELVNLLYHNHAKYDRGEETALVLPTSTATVLRKSKRLGENQTQKVLPVSHFFSLLSFFDHDDDA